MSNTGVPPSEIRIGGTYRTHAARWTVSDIRAGMVFLIREDGRTAKFSVVEFAGWVIAEKAR